MAILYGTESRVYGINGNVKQPGAGSDTVWSELTANTECIITGYTYTPAAQGVVEGYDQTGLLTTEAFAYATFELTINFEFGGSDDTNAKSLKLPALMAKIEIENMDNTDLNGTYNFRSGSVTGSNQGWKTGTMTLRAVSVSGTNITSASKVAFPPIS